MFLKIDLENPVFENVENTILAFYENIWFLVFFEFFHNTKNGNHIDLQCSLCFFFFKSKTNFQKQESKQLLIWFMLLTTWF